MRRPSQRYFAAENLDPRLRAGLVGHWIGGGSGYTWLDRSGYGNHAAITGAKWTLGEGGKRPALQFGGTDWCDFGTDNVLNVSNALTIAFWWRSGGSPGGGYHAFVQRFGGATTGYQVYSSGGGLGFYTSTVTGASGSIPADDAWHHLAITNDGALTRFWIDGVAAGSSAQGLVSITTATATTIGKYAGFAGANGRMDDVRIYDRALSQAEVSLLAQPSFLPVVPRRWFVGLPQSTTAATSSVSTWVSPTASTRASVAASPSIASWASPTASTKASVSASPAVSTWVVPNATTRTPRILPTVSVSRTVYANIPASRTVYDPIEVS